jgi:LemA protein
MIIVVPIALVLLLTPIVIAVVCYNRLVGFRNRYRSAYSQIDVQLKRRNDLIPNLVQSAQGYIKHERGTLEAVTSARNAASGANVVASQNPGDATAMQTLNAAEGLLAANLNRLLAVAEAYPDLKANQPMRMLMEDLTSTENRVAFARQAYNDAVMFYNTACQAFPSAFIARAFRFEPAQMFVVDTQADKAVPAISFSANEPGNAGQPS